MSPHKIDLPEKADFSYIQDIAGGQKEAFRNLLRIVGKNLKEYPPQLLQAHRAEDAENMQKLAHKYKSCTAYLNFPQLDERLNELEYGEQNSRSAKEELQLIEEIATLSDFMAKEVDRALEQEG